MNPPKSYNGIKRIVGSHGKPIRCEPVQVGGFRDTGEPHHYGDNGAYLEVSEAAYQEKRRNWHEIAGVADGYAIVEHPDWAAMYEFMLADHPHKMEHYRNPKSWGPSYLVIVKRPNGELAFAGSICRRDGRIELNG